MRDDLRRKAVALVADGRFVHAFEYDRHLPPSLRDIPFHCLRSRVVKGREPSGLGQVSAANGYE